jgi:hypothetical protein
MAKRKKTKQKQKRQAIVYGTLPYVGQYSMERREF